MSKRPSYPTVGLTKGLESIRKLWREAGQSPFMHEAGVKAIGFKALSGPSRSHLSALKQYGLLEEAGKETLRLSALAKQIVAHPDGSDEQESAIREAALTPPLFKDLWENYQSASDGIIKGHLISARNYNEDGARAAIKAFRDTVARARLAPGSSEEIFEKSTDFESVGEAAHLRPALNTFSRVRLRERGLEELTFRLGPNSKVSLRFSSEGPLTMQDIDLLIRMLELQKVAFPDAPAGRSVEDE